jgi:hypothetical protein
MRPFFFLILFLVQIPVSQARVTVSVTDQEAKVLFGLPESDRVIEAFANMDYESRDGLIRISCPYGRCEARFDLEAEWQLSTQVKIVRAGNSFYLEAGLYQNDEALQLFRALQVRIERDRTFPTRRFKTFTTQNDLLSITCDYHNNSGNPRDERIGDDEAHRLMCGVRVYLGWGYSEPWKHQMGKAYDPFEKS